MDHTPIHPAVTPLGVLERVLMIYRESIHGKMGRCPILPPTKVSSTVYVRCACELYRRVAVVCWGPRMTNGSRERESGN